MPLITPPQTDEVIIDRDPDDKPDDNGRTKFFAWWYDPKTPAEAGPPDHNRGQIFYTDLTEFVKRVAADGKTVRYIHGRPEFAPRAESAA